MYLKLLLYILFSNLPLSTHVIYVHHIPCCTDPANAAATQASKEEVDSRSVFVGNVRFECPSIIVVLLGNPMFLDYHTCLPRFSYVLLYRCLDLHASCMKTSCMVLSNS